MKTFCLENVSPAALTYLLKFSSKEGIILFLEELEQGFVTVNKLHLEWKYYLQYPTGYQFIKMQKEGRFKPNLR